MSEENVLSMVLGVISALETTLVAWEGGPTEPAVAMTSFDIVHIIGALYAHDIRLIIKLFGKSASVTIHLVRLYV